LGDLIRQTHAKSGIGSKGLKFMKPIESITLNPAIDKSARVDHVAVVMTPGSEFCRLEDAERVYERMVAGA
jgi:hypothetical protein